MTRKRRAQQFKIKAIIILTAIAVGAGVIGAAGEYTNAIIERYGSGMTRIEINVARAAEQSVEDKIRAIAAEENFRWPDYLVRLAWCESRFNQYAIGDSGKSRGLFQIHSGFHPEVSNDCAFDMECSTKWTIDKINQGKQGLWSCDKIIKNKK